jgi:hypothetical protein
VRLSGEQARALADLLRRAADVVESAQAVAAA